MAQFYEHLNIRQNYRQTINIYCIELKYVDKLIILVNKIMCVFYQSFTFCLNPNTMSFELLMFTKT